MEARVGEGAARVLEHVSGEVASGAVVATPDERDEALARAASHVEDPVSDETVLARERLEPREPDVVWVMARERVVVGRERRVGTLGAGSPHLPLRPAERCKWFRLLANFFATMAPDGPRPRLGGAQPALPQGGPVANGGPGGRRRRSAGGAHTRMARMEPRA